jgi:hypothetical protein
MDITSNLNLKTYLRVWHYCHLFGMSRSAILCISNGSTQFFQVNTTPVGLTMTTSSHTLPITRQIHLPMQSFKCAMEEVYQMKQETDYSQSVPQSTSLYH